LLRIEFPPLAALGILPRTSLSRIFEKKKECASSFVFHGSRYTRTTGHYCARLQLQTNREREGGRSEAAEEEGVKGKGFMQELVLVCEFAGRAFAYGSRIEKSLAN